jgi:hypothetical protein
MKLINIIAACISILFISQYIYAQHPDPNSFFPYSVGNIWEYDQDWYSNAKEQMSSIENIKKFIKPNEIVRYEILRDSVGHDGHIYLSMVRFSIHFGVLIPLHQLYITILND